MNKSMKFIVLAACLLTVVSVVGCGGGDGVKKEALKTVEAMGPEEKIRLATSFFSAGKIGKAMQILENSMEIYPDNTAIRNYYGQLSLLTGNLEQAEKALLEVLEANPYMTDAHNTLGAVYQEMGRYNDAEAEYQKALQDRMYATPEKAYMNLGLLYKAQERTEEAIGMLRKSVETDPQYLQAHYELAGALEEVGNHREAAREYGVAEPAFRKSGEFHYRYGVVLMQLGKKPEASEQFRKVIALSPGSENSARADELLEMMN
jgi:Tfp pilus assembly protein PilF